MSASFPNQGDVLAASAAAGAFNVIAPAEETLVDLRRRIDAMEWPERNKSRTGPE
jgi:hypothetical protein